MPESHPISTRVLATALAPELRIQLQPQVLSPILATKFLNLSLLRTLTVSDQLANAPHISEPPAKVERAIAGVGGGTWFVPQARLAQRSKATTAPHVFLVRRDGEVFLQVWFDLVRFASLPTGSQPLPVDGFRATLVTGTGERIEFERCDELPPSDQPEYVVSQLFCETKVDVNRVVTILQTDAAATFRVEGTVHYATGGTPNPGPVAFTPMIATALLPSIATATVAPKPKPKPRMMSRRLGSALSRARLNTVTAVTRAASRVRVAQPAAPAPTAPTKQSKVLSLGAADNTGMGANFRVDLRENRAIYAQVTTGFGSEPWSEWVHSPNGHFVDSPVPDQFYVLPDEYRLAFDAETAMPAMMVLLVPPSRADGDDTPATFGGDYTIRCRFTVVPYLDPAKLRRLRDEIATNSGIAYPQLVVGGVRSATCELSKVLHELGSSLVGESDSSMDVDALGFDLVLDCTSEFYNTLTHLLVTDGVDASVSAHLVSDEEHPQTVDLPVTLRLDRPSLDFLTVEMIPAEPVAHADGDADASAPTAPPSMRISNPTPYPVRVGRIEPTLLVVDETLPSPIGAVGATADPTSCELMGSADGSAVTQDVQLTPNQSGLPPFYGAIGVDLIDVSVDIDPAAVLAKAHDLGASADLSSAVELRSYQLEHPDVLPDTMTDLFGIEVQLRREDAEPVTIFLTKDQPSSTVQVSFSLVDILAGAKPEQPKFSWRRRNMAGSGTGEWSEWETIIGRQLFVSPNGI